MMYLGYFGDFGSVAADSGPKQAFRALTDLNLPPGSDSQAGKSEWGTSLEFLGVVVNFSFIQGSCKAEFSLSPARMEELLEETGARGKQRGVYVAQIRKLVG